MPVRSLYQLLPCRLFAFAVFSEIGYLALVRLNAVNGRGPVLSFLAWMTYLFALYAVAYRLLSKSKPRTGRGSLVVILCAALLFRITLLPAGLAHAGSYSELRESLRQDLRGQAVTYNQFLLFDSDLWRFLWDGHVSANHVSPYRYPPDSSTLDPLTDPDNSAVAGRNPAWDDIRSYINHPWLPTIYPPLMQAVFRLSHRLAPGSVLMLKAILTGFDLLTLLFLTSTLRHMGKPPEWVLLYAWNPLVIKVISGSGHTDGLVALTLAATTYFLVRNDKLAATLTFALAVLVKLTPLVLLPFLLKRVGWRRALIALPILLAGFFPLLHAAEFAGFNAVTRAWLFNAGPFTAITALAGLFTPSPAPLARILTLSLFLLLLVRLMRRDDGSPHAFAALGAHTLGLLIILSPTVMPWYLIWLLPFAALARSIEWFSFSFLVGAAFFVMIRGVEYPYAQALEYACFALVLAAIARAKRRPPPHLCPGDGEIRVML